MLPLDVRACLSDLMVSLYTRTIMELIANKFGVMPVGQNKLKVAMDFLSKIAPERELEVVQKVVGDARETVMRGGYDSEIVGKKLSELERVLEGSLLMYVDSQGNISPIVETSIRPDVEEQKGYLQQEMTELGFTLACSHLTQALERLTGLVIRGHSLFLEILCKLSWKISFKNGERLLIESSLIPLDCWSM